MLENYTKVFWHFTGSPNDVRWDLVKKRSDILNFGGPKSPDIAFSILKLILTSKTLKSGKCNEKIVDQLEIKPFCSVTKLPVYELINHSKYFGKVALEKLSFEISQNDLISRLRDAGEELENLTLQRSEIYENISTIRQKLGKVKNQQALVEDSLNEALKQKKDLVFNLKRLDAELLKTGFNQEVDPIVLQRDVDSLVAYISKGTFFREKILVAEIVADSEEKTAVVTRLIDKKSKLLNQKRTLKNDLENNKIKLATLKSIQNYLDIIQQNSMVTYFKAIGPMATLIQSKLRPVYGFGDMSIDYSEKNVTVKVDWQKSSNSLRPSDYFSESQVGILAYIFQYCIYANLVWAKNYYVR